MDKSGGCTEEGAHGLIGARRFFKCHQGGGECRSEIVRWPLLTYSIDDIKPNSTVE